MANLELELSSEDGVKEDRLLRNFALQHVESFLGCHCPYEGLPLFSERIEGQGYFGKPCNESPVKIAESVKGADILNAFRGRPIANS